MAQETRVGPAAPPIRSHLEALEILCLNELESPLNLTMSTAPLLKRSNSAPICYADAGITFLRLHDPKDAACTSQMYPCGHSRPIISCDSGQVPELPSRAAYWRFCPWPALQSWTVALSNIKSTQSFCLMER